jgi:hypothetical protein
MMPCLPRFCQTHAAKPGLLIDVPNGFVRCHMARRYRKRLHMSRVRAPFLLIIPGEIDFFGLRQKEAWRVPFSLDQKGEPILCSKTALNCAAYWPKGDIGVVSDIEQRVFAYRMSTGERLWSINTGLPVGRLAIWENAATLYVGIEGGFHVNLNSGKARGYAACITLLRLSRRYCISFRTTHLLHWTPRTAADPTRKRS